MYAGLEGQAGIHVSVACLDLANFFAFCYLEFLTVKNQETNCGLS